MTALCDRVIPALGFGPQQLGQRHAPQAQPANLEEVAAGNPIAITGTCPSRDCEHPVTPLCVAFHRLIVVTPWLNNYCDGENSRTQVGTTTSFETYLIIRIDQATSAVLLSG